MKAFFEAIQSLFVDFLFKPLDAFRALELKGYWGWVYWCKQLNLHKQNNEDYQDTTAHSFLEK